MEDTKRSISRAALFLIALEPNSPEWGELGAHLRSLLEAWVCSESLGEELRTLVYRVERAVADKDAPTQLEMVDAIGSVLERAQEELEDHGGDSPVQAMEPGSERAAPGDPGVPEDTRSPEPTSEPKDGALFHLPEDADDSLVLDFVGEGLDYLDEAEEALLALEADPTDAEAVNVTFRAFHTIKGVSAFLDLDRVTKLAHETETLLARVRDGSLALTGSAADLFLNSTDVLRGLLNALKEHVAGRPVIRPAKLDALMALLDDPSIGDRIAANEPLGLDDGVDEQEDESPTAMASSGAGGGDTGSRSSHGGESVRIGTERLDRLVDLVGELVIAHSMISQDPQVTEGSDGLKRKVNQSQKIIRELQDLATSIRMVPLQPSFQKISRIVRDVCKKSGKQVELVTSGEETELDRGMVALITDCLVHMVRNSIDHGIESSADRVKAGKPAEGQLVLTARHSGGNVVLDIEDDGQGLDREKLFAKAVERGIVSADRKLSDQEVYSLIFRAGFSTADQVTDISGRGVGMDVVRRAVESLRGRIEISSERGKGTRFSIFLPLTLAITDGMLIRVGRERYIIPTMKVQLSFRPEAGALWTVAGKGEMVMVLGEPIPVLRLHRLFGIPDAHDDVESGILMVVGQGERRSALLVDELLGQAQFVVKPLSGLVSGSPGIAGGAILGDGGVGLILDPEELILPVQSAHKTEAA